MFIHSLVEDLQLDLLSLLKIQFKKSYFCFICNLNGLKSGTFIKVLKDGGLLIFSSLKTTILSTKKILFMIQKDRQEYNGQL